MPCSVLAGLGAEVLRRLADGSAPGSGERAGRLNALSNPGSRPCGGAERPGPGAREAATTAYRELARARLSGVTLRHKALDEAAAIFTE